MSEQATPARRPAARPLRAIAFSDPAVTIEQTTDGTLYLRPRNKLGVYPLRLTDRLHHWAKAAPDRVFMAERVGDGSWRQLTYAQLLTASRHIASALLSRGLSVEKPVVILSGNSIDHALVAFGALYAGVPFCPVSPAYSLISRDFGKLASALKLLTPGLIFVDDTDRFATAVSAAVPQEIEIAASFGGLRGRDVTSLAELMATPLHPGLDSTHETIDPDTIAKFLLTSGSTGNPKAVINTQRMLCANQVMLRETMSFLKDEPPVIVDWLPWSHTFGGNHNFGLVLDNGGSLYIDEGKPLPGFIEATVRNLREIAPTIYFNVPKGFEMLLPYLAADARLRETFFSRLKVMFYAGAALAQHVLDGFTELAVKTTGERILFMSSLGSTETAPAALSCNWQSERAGNIGLPLPGVTLKLLSCEGKLEARLKGDNIMPGYWRDKSLSVTPG